MLKLKSNFYLLIISISTSLFFLHTVLNHLLLKTIIIIDLWKIYCFNSVSLIFMCLVLQFFKNSKKKILSPFIILTIFKMGFSVLFLNPIFNYEYEKKLEIIITFFVVYFLFLVLEIFSIKVFILKL